jgi:hypothetical protein
MMCFNIIPLAPSSSTWSLRDRFPSQKFVCLSLLSHVCHMPYLIFDCKILVIVNEKHQSSIFWLWKAIYVYNSIGLTNVPWGTQCFISQGSTIFLVVGFYWYFNLFWYLLSSMVSIIWATSLPCIWHHMNLICQLGLHDL